MKSSFYKQRKGKLVCGVVAGLADKYNWDLALSRVLIALILYFAKFGLLLYILLAVFLPYKEDIIETRRQGPRRRKDAEPVDDDGWFW
ncbi:TPA: PspC domain-containing protein [Streptococcus agalactiae]